MNMNLRHSKRSGFACLFRSFAALAVFFVASGAIANAVEIRVDDDGIQCPTATFPTIQAAVNAANSGDIIRVCAGTYPEQVQIVGKSNLTIRGDNRVLVQPAGVIANSTSTASGGPIAAIILVDNSTRIIIENITVDGSDNGLAGCSPTFVGIYYRKSTGQILFGAVRNIKLGAGLEGCQSGLAIFAEAGSDADPGGLTTLDVISTSVHDYQKNGITGNELNTTLNVRNSFITGIGPTEAAAQNGIQLAFGAVGLIQENNIINQIFAGCRATDDCDAASTGILVFATGSTANRLRLFSNSIGKTQGGIVLFDTNGVVAQSNRVFDTDVFDGIAVFGTSNRILTNMIFNSDESGVFVSGESNRITSNTINEAQIGVFNDTPSGGNAITGNSIFNTPQPLVTASAPVENTAARTATPTPQRSINPSPFR